MWPYTTLENEWISKMFPTTTKETVVDFMDRFVKTACENTKVYNTMYLKVFEDGFSTYKKQIDLFTKQMETTLDAAKKAA